MHSRKVTRCSGLRIGWDMQGGLHLSMVEPLIWFRIVFVAGGSLASFALPLLPHQIPGLCGHCSGSLKVLFERLS